MIEVDNAYTIVTRPTDPHYIPLDTPIKLPESERPLKKENDVQTKPLNSRSTKQLGKSYRPLQPTKARDDPGSRQVIVKSCPSFPVRAPLGLASIVNKRGV